MSTTRDPRLPMRRRFGQALAALRADTEPDCGDGGGRPGLRDAAGSTRTRPEPRAGFSSPPPSRIFSTFIWPGA